MRQSLVSILVPLFNEEELVGEALRRAIAASLPEGLRREIIVVDDGSTDGSAAVVESIVAQHPDLVQLVRSSRNKGKGAAIRTAIDIAEGEYCLIQDADLEYNPQEYSQLLQPLVDGVADVVYGSRFASAGRRRVLYYWHTVANRFLTTLSNIASDLNLTDIETGYKAFRTSLLKTVPIRSDRFGIEPELTIKLAKRQAIFYEVPISYEGRTYEDGKKIGLLDAFQAVFVILRNVLTDDLYRDRGAEILDAFSVAPRFNRWMADTIRPFVGKRVLEIGAGMGNLTRQFAKRRERYLATDIDGEHLKRLQNRLQHQPRLETYLCDLSKREDFMRFSGAMDTVICLNVLEHMENDVECLRNILHALEPGGRAIVLVPCGQELFGPLDVVLGHFRRYSKEQIQNVMTQAGFELEAIIDFNHISRPGWFIKSRILKQSRIARYQIRAFDAFVWLWRRIDRLLPWGPTSIIAIASKPTQKPSQSLLRGIVDAITGNLH
jgi:glycosyltransferase involved in cell wall biosynthesis/phospholipid N-methyltransferase